MVSLRERKKQKTRDALIASATKLFIEKGFEATTADEIAEAAMVSRVTFFRYFKTKDSVVFPYQKERIDLLKNMIMAHEENHTPLEAVRLGLLDMGRYFMSIREELLIQRRIIHESPFLRSRQIDFDMDWERSLADRLVANTNRRVSTVRLARLTSGAIFGMVGATLEEWFDGECKKDLVRMGREGMKLLENGFSATVFAHKSEGGEDQ